MSSQEPTRHAGDLALLSAIPRTFGEPVFAVVTGSLGVGLGNRRSDVDVYSVVDADVQRAPLVQFDDDRRVDVRMLSLASARSARAWLDWPRVALPEGRISWLRARDGLETLTRLALGRPLIGAPEWRREIGQQQVRQAVRAWWHTECRRRSLYRELLWDSATARHQWFMTVETVVAGLEARAADHGEIYFGEKWLGPKLIRAGLRREAALLPSIAPLAPADRQTWSMCEEVIRAETAGSGSCGDDLYVHASLGPGVIPVSIGGRTFLARDGFEWVDISDAPPSAQRLLSEPGVPEPLANGRECLTAIADLLARGMVWFALTATDGRR